MSCAVTVAVRGVLARRAISPKYWPSVRSAMWDSVPLGPAVGWVGSEGGARAARRGRRRTRRCYAHGAAGDDVEGVRRAALLTHGVAPGGALVAEEGAEHLELGLLDEGEEGDFAEEEGHAVIGDVGHARAHLLHPRLRAEALPPLVGEDH